MKHKLKISVVVIAYNAEKTISACLSSLYKQDFLLKDYEVILVNDHSKDNTCEFAKKYHKVRIINQRKNIHGISNARNFGIQNTRSNIVAFTDSDCIVPKNWLSRMYNYLSNNPQYVAVGGSLKAIKTNNLISYIDGIIGEAYGNTSKLATPNSAYIKSYLYKVGIFDTQLITGEDPDLNWRLEKYGFKLKYLSNLIVKHLWRSSLKSFITHQFNYGRGRAQLIKKYPNKFSIFERNLISCFLIIFIIITKILFTNVYLSFFIIIIFMILFSLLRRLNIINIIYHKNNFLIVLISLFFLILIDIINILGIFYHRLIEISKKIYN